MVIDIHSYSLQGEEDEDCSNNKSNRNRMSSTIESNTIVSDNVDNSISTNSEVESSRAAARPVIDNTTNSNSESNSSGDSMSLSKNKIKKKDFSFTTDSSDDNELILSLASKSRRTSDKDDGNQSISALRIPPK